MKAFKPTGLMQLMDTESGLRNDKVVSERMKSVKESEQGTNEIEALFPDSRFPTLARLRDSVTGTPPLPNN